MKSSWAIFFALPVSVLVGCSRESAGQAVPRPRVVITCDPELDDHNSLLRYLLYSTDYDTQGLVYASSHVHWKGDGKGTTQYLEDGEYARLGLGPQTSWRWKEGERFIDEDVDAYEKVYPNLVKHHPGYPSPASLRSVIREGNTAFESDYSEDTPGSDLIRDLLLDDDPRPVFVQVWGGPSTVARALKSIEETYAGAAEWDAVRAKVIAKCKLCLSGAQDTSFSEYIHPVWPEVESVMLNAGVTPLGYFAFRDVREPADTLYFSAPWTRENISSKGLLGSMYRVWGDGKQMVPGDVTDYFGLSGYTATQLQQMGYSVWAPVRPAGSFISEGDTPVFLNLVGNGLRAFEAQEWGGWGGRRKELSEMERAWGFTMPFAIGGKPDSVLPSFVEAVQNGFAARLSWSVTSDYAAVNHEPNVSGPLTLQGHPGEEVTLRVKISDPDGNAVSCSWAHWKVTGSFQGDVFLSSPDTPLTQVKIPDDAKPGETIHLILTAIDDGTPRLTRYLRTIVTVL